LRRTDYGEFDAVVTFLTRDAGKLACIARGVKRPRSKNSPACQMFVLSRLSLAAGRRLPVLTQTDIVESFYGLREDVWRAAYATYLCELVDRALPDEEPHPGLYELLLATLRGVIASAEPEALAHSFELRLLAELGYEPVLDRCARCGEAIGEEEALFSPAAGGLVHVEEHDPREPAVQVSPRVVAAMRRLLRPERYEVDLLRTQIPSALAAPLRQAVRAHLAFHLETEPKSLRFLDQLRRLEPD
ncbi:MAG: DNA repair protein RecO, partial [Armatimonadetes bacterium]|nr:DNA repair protein RecO [Armatimonadota bacterium]